MSEVLRLKSNLVQLFDYKSVDLSEYFPKYEVDEKLLDKDIHRVLNKYGKKEEAETIQEGDMVTLSCVSSESRFNKNNIPVIIGKGLYSKELEEKLIEKGKGTYTLLINDTKVEVHVISIIRTILPEMNDESIKALNIEGIQSVKDLKKFCVDKQIVRVLDDCEDFEMASAKVWMEFSENCTYDFDEEEYQEALDAAKVKTKELEENQVQFASEEEKAQSDKEYEEEFGQKREDIDLYEFCKKMSISELQLAVVGYEEACKRDMALTMDDYEAYIQSWKDYNPDKTIEELKASHPVKQFIIQKYNDIICDDLDAYVLELFKSKMNPYA